MKLIKVFSLLLVSSLSYSQETVSLEVAKVDNLGPVLNDIISDYVDEHQEMMNDSSLVLCLRIEPEISTVQGVPKSVLDSLYSDLELPHSHTNHGIKVIVWLMENQSALSSLARPLVQSSYIHYRNGRQIFIESIFFESIFEPTDEFVTLEAGTEIDLTLRDQSFAIYRYIPGVSLSEICTDYRVIE